MIAGSGRYTRERIGYPLQYSLASLVARTVKNPPAMQETWVQSLGWEDPLEEGMARSPGGGHGNSLQFSGLDNLYAQRYLEGYNP